MGAGVSLRPIGAYAPVGGQYEKAKREIDPKNVARVMKKGYKISRTDRFRYRSKDLPG
jgi:hypothetical protein